MIAVNAAHDDICEIKWNNFYYILNGNSELNPYNQNWSDYGVL